MQLISELKRRKVFRVVAGYVVFSWLLIQVAETLFPLFGFDCCRREMATKILLMAMTAHR